jgi:hypothetical protein
MSSEVLSILPFIYKVNRYIINPLIMLVFAVAFLVFFFGVFQFIKGASEASERESGKKKILWGVVGMFIMFSAYGLVRLVVSTFDIDAPSTVTDTSIYQ